MAPNGPVVAVGADLQRRTVHLDAREEVIEPSGHGNADPHHLAA